ncbi:MFS transporter [Actinosynnema sp. NPDC020468]|uniref:MFS transporter n=1 Tax=Actinosynnema sp. NPDC020468 TaxID=3154488 RepID=UPI0033C17ADB
MTQDVQAGTRWTPVVALALAMLVVATEMTVAAVALPGIGAELDVGPGATAWVLLAYTLPTAVAIPAGRWVDRADVRPAFLGALVLVVAASVLTAAAPAFWVLLVGRLAQGVASAVVLAAYLPIVVANVRADRRGRAIGSIVTIMTVGGLAGAPLGGVVAGAFGWRAVFLLKVPVLVAALVLGWRSLRGDGRGLPVPDRSLLVEALLLGGAITAAVLAVGGRPWLLVVTVVLGVLWARLPAARPVLDLARRRAVGFPLLSLGLVSTLGGLLFFLVPYHVTDALRGSPSDVGVALLVFVAGVAALSAVSGVLADRIGPRPVALAGAVVTLAGVALLLVPVDDLTGLCLRLAVVGVGQGLFNAPVNALLMAAAPAGREGAVGGTGASARMIGSSLGPAVAALAAPAGFRVGVAVLGAILLVGTIALAAGRAD